MPAVRRKHGFIEVLCLKQMTLVVQGSSLLKNLRYFRSPWWQK
jgi:hypothetical protein